MDRLNSLESVDEFARAEDAPLNAGALASTSGSSVSRDKRQDMNHLKHPSGAKARMLICRVCGTTEVVPCYKALL
ncbi:MAG: hypothetical protein WBE41_25595, partial [Terracidiphilus sp.]